MWTDSLLVEDAILTLAVTTSSNLTIRRFGPDTTLTSMVRTADTNGS
jgi:hypothetical protein